MILTLLARVLAASPLFLAAAASAGAPSFPGASGFGATTPGGRGGPVIAVTSLADSGPGTLRQALERTDGPRIVVFAVEGEINLSRQIAARGSLTLLGQVAPGAGVTVTGSSIRIDGDDVIVRGMRLRPGDGPGQDKSVRDALTVGVTDRSGRRLRRIVIDGNSLSMATDENVNLWSGVLEVTVSNNIIAEALDADGRGDAFHSLGMLVGDGVSDVTISGNLFISNEFRNPTIADATNIEIINNLVYNYKQHALSFTVRDWMFTNAHVIGNVFERGPESGKQKAVRILGKPDNAAIWLHDNISADRPDSTYPEDAVAGGKTRAEPVPGHPDETPLRSGPVFPQSGVRAIPARQVRDHVLSRAGARNPQLDPVDARLVSEVANGGGRLVASMADAPEAPPDPRAGGGFPPDRDGDFVPDAVELRLGSDPDRPDSHLPASGTPYTAIELYADALAKGG